MQKLIDPSPTVKAVALQLMLERDRCMRDCDEALALRFVDRVKTASRATTASQSLEASP